MIRVVLFFLLIVPFLVQAQDSRKYYTGPKGGCYYINKNGNKTYVDRSFCTQTLRSERASQNEKPESDNGQYKAVPDSGAQASTIKKVYYKGPKGGCYYISKAGNKVYVDRALCN